MTASLVPHAHASPEASASHGVARIGPNAIIQTAATLVDRVGAAETTAILTAATPWRLDRLPSEMVDERDVTALMRGVAEHFSAVDAEAIMREAGVRTADYLLRVRIPRVAQRVLGLLPRQLGLRLLLSAITKHSWTFAGSAEFVVQRHRDQGTTFTLRGCPVCRGMTAASPVCHYYAATVEHLVSTIVVRQARVRELTCEAMGAASCRFAITL